MPDRNREVASLHTPPSDRRKETVVAIENTLEQTRQALLALEAFLARAEQGGEGAIAARAKAAAAVLAFGSNLAQQWEEEARAIRSRALPTPVREMDQSRQEELAYASRLLLAASEWRASVTALARATEAVRGPASRIAEAISLPEVPHPTTNYAIAPKALLRRRFAEALLHLSQAFEHLMYVLSLLQQTSGEGNEHPPSIPQEEEIASVWGEVGSALVKGARCFGELSKHYLPLPKAAMSDSREELAWETFWTSAASVLLPLWRWMEEVSRWTDAARRTLKRERRFLEESAQRIGARPADEMLQALADAEAKLRTLEELWRSTREA